MTTFLEIDTKNPVITAEDLLVLVDQSVHLNTIPGAVIFHDGQFHMFYNSCCVAPLETPQPDDGRRVVPLIWATVYATSQDRLVWEVQSQEPVLRGDMIPYSGGITHASSVLVEDDGTWVMYFHFFPHFDDEAGMDGIGRATAPAPEGPWTPNPEPVLLPGEPGQWDDTLLIAPTVVKFRDAHLLYYSNESIPAPSGYSRRIGVAVSQDGINWEKYDDPSTNDPLYAASDPIFEPWVDNGLRDSENTLYPNVVVTEGGLLVMLYQAHNSLDRRDEAIGFAFSEDGLNWTRAAFDPLFSSADIARRRIGSADMTYHDGTFYIYLELQREYQNQTDIYAGRVGDFLGNSQ
jgi:hypothetical protein